ncbi:MAG: hypothetical protein EP330_08990 [Deltaproteobacteria bacterium]|nr:MAG: hypothetical protein EP330_08990 [Deltaproteobacteria bacterium]
MRYLPSLVLLLPLVAGCNIELGPERNCADRSTWYPDEDGDGIGEPTAMYVGCEAPAGWVDNVDTAYTGARRRRVKQGWRLALRGVR